LYFLGCQRQQRTNSVIVTATQAVDTARQLVDPDGLVLSRVAQVQYNEPHPDLKADVDRYILELLDKCLKVESQITGYSVNIRPTAANRCGCSACRKFDSRRRHHF
jgi:hypothetical protein